MECGDSQESCSQTVSNEMVVWVSESMVSLPWSFLLCGPQVQCLISKEDNICSCHAKATRQSETVLKAMEIANSQWKDVSIACNTRTSHCHKMFSFVLAQNAQCLCLFWSVDNMFQLKCKNGFISKHQQCVKPMVASARNIEQSFTVKQNQPGFLIWSTQPFFEWKKFAHWRRKITKAIRTKVDALSNMTEQMKKRSVAPKDVHFWSVCKQKLWI